MPAITEPFSATVLCVDDSDSARYFRSHCLRGAGYQVIEAATGAEALTLALERQPALIVLDIRLPDLDGFEVCKRLKADPATQTIPVLHVSAAGQVEHDLPESLAHYADVYLREPIEPETLIAAAGALIRTAQAERRARQAEQHAAHILESIADPVVAFDKEWRYTYISGLAARQLGKTPGELMGKCIWDLFPADAGGGFENACREAWEKKTPVTVECYSSVLDQWVENHIYPLEDGAIAQWRDVSARKCEEQARKRQRELLQAVIDNIPVMLCLYDPGLNAFEVNRECERVLGWTNADANEGDFMAKVYPDPAYRAGVIEYMRSLAPGWREIQATAKDGSVIATEWANIRLSDDRMIGIGMDLRPRKQAEEALRESEARYRTLFESMQEGFAVGEIICDEIGNPQDWRYVDVNSAFEAMSGRSRHELIGQRYRELFPDAPWQYWVAALGRVALTGEPAHLQQYGPDKGRHYEAIAYSPRPGRFAAIFADITERRRAEQQYETLAENAPEVIARFDTQFRHIYINNYGAKVYGIPKSQILGRTSAELSLPPDKVAFWKRHFEEVLATGRQQTVDFEFDSPNFGRQHFSSLFVPEKDERGRVTSILAITRDLTERTRAEDRLRQAQKLESIGLLAGGIAHDFNNLLTGIMGNASMVLEDVGPASVERVREILSSAERAANLTRQLLAYSGKGQFVVRDLDISQAVNQMSDLVQFSISKSIGLKLDLETRLPLVRMDPTQFQQILMNLVINAGEAIGEGRSGRIVVATGMTDIETAFVDAAREEIAPGRYVYVEVSDTGAGMDEETKARIFDPFFTTKFTGRGLGLAAVSGIVRSCKGAITVRSERGGGATFRVLLPVAETPGQKSETGVRANDRGTILVIDDEAYVREFIASALTHYGYRVLVASDGRDALAVGERERWAIDAAVLDVVMPVMGAQELLPVVKAKQPRMRILLTSGYSEAEAKRLCSDYPGAAFIQKPYTGQRIAKSIEELLRR